MQAADIGSSLIRGAARVLTGVPHYVQASYITAQEEAARNRPDALAAARAMLAGFARADRLDRRRMGPSCFARARPFRPPGVCGPRRRRTTRSRRCSTQGSSRMPLWGLSLDRAVTEQYGGRFLFEVVGPFPALPAWLESGVGARGSRADHRRCLRDPSG